VTRAWALGFTSITARGIDIADEQVRRAQTRSRNLAALGGVSLDFEIGTFALGFPKLMKALTSASVSMVF